MSISIFLKRNLYSLLFYSKLLELYSKKAGGKSIVLAYHRVLPEDSPLINLIQPGMYVTTRTFEMHMKYLAENYNVMSLEDIHSEKIKRDTCIITFDDGWSDNYEFAYPIMKKYGIPATIFITTNMIESDNWPWPDKLYYFSYKASKDNLNKILKLIEELSPDKHNGREKRNFNNRGRIAEYIISKIKELANESLLMFLTSFDEMMNAAGEHRYPKRLWLTWNEIKEMSQNNVSFGAHTHNHVILTNTSLDKAENEIVQSKDILSRLTGRPIRTFSYPNGNFNDDIIGILKRNDFSLAVTTRSGCIESSMDPFKIPRLMLHNDISSIVPMFYVKIKQLF